MATINLNFDNLREIDLSQGEDYEPQVQYRPPARNNNSSSSSNAERYQEPKPRVNVLDMISDEGIFELERLDNQASGLIQLVISNDQLVMATSQNSIIRIDVNDNQGIRTYEGFAPKNDKIYRIFLDPTGNHLIIVMESRDVYYHHSSFRLPKQQKHWKVGIIESVAWDPKEDPAMVNVLLGTSSGAVFEAMVVGKEKGLLEFSSKDPPIRQLYMFEEPEPLHGLSLKRIDKKYFLLVSTPTRLYYLIGGPTLDALFKRDHVICDIMPDDSPYRDYYGVLKFYGTHYAWLIASGIHYGELVYGSQGADEKFTASSNMLHFDQNSNGKAYNSIGIPSHPPISFAMTQFHFLLLYEDRFVALGKLNNQIAYEILFSPKDPKLKGISVDNEKNTIWVYGDSTLMELIVKDEDRNAWKHYMDKAQFDTALSYVKEPYAAEKKDQIWQTQADRYFMEGKYELAATFYGKTHKVFEEITLKFINANQRDALKSYLLQKLQTMPGGATTQKTIICTWLVEIFISKLNTLRDPKDEAKYQMVNAEFRQYLENFKDVLFNIKEIVFNIISSHGAIEELLFYANLIEDYERVISYHIQHQQYDKALGILMTLNKPKAQPQQYSKYQQQQSNPQPNPDELYYKFCPVLFHFIPILTCDAWMQTRPNFLDPKKLIPSLMRYDHKKTPLGYPNQAIRYLQHCVGKLKNKDKAVHNYLLSLYVKQDDDRPILEFLSTPEAYYDLKYALRLCMKEKKLKACVLIYSAMELYEEAVDLALEVDIDLAKENADKLRDTDEALCKKLWLRIAKHVVEKGSTNDGRDNSDTIKEAMEFLKNCDLLKIEDILPFFSDFTVIDDFKEEICKSLENYNSRIDVLKADMDFATESAKLIRNDINNLRNKYGYVRSDQKCDICNYPVLTKRFYLFNCQHVFHSDCLITELMKFKSNDQKQRLRELQMMVNNSSDFQRNSASANSVPSASSMSSGNLDAVQSQEDSNRNELDRIVGKECIYCGDLMIKLIEKPFISPDEGDILESWEI